MTIHPRRSRQIELDYSVEARRERRFERDRMFFAERELWRAQYLIRQGKHVSISRDPSDDDIERMSRAWCFMEGCDNPGCKSEASCEAWDMYENVARAAHAALVRTDG